MRKFPCRVHVCAKFHENPRGSGFFLLIWYGMTLKSLLSHSNCLGVALPAVTIYGYSCFIAVEITVLSSCSNCLGVALPTFAMTAYLFFTGQQVIGASLDDPIEVNPHVLVPSSAEDCLMCKHYTESTDQFFHAAQ